MLSTFNDNNESKNSLASGRILNMLNNFLQQALLLVPAIILMILFSMENTFHKRLAQTGDTMSLDQLAFVAKIAFAVINGLWQQDTITDLIVSKEDMTTKRLSMIP
jgi:hypothetical protein